MRKLLCFVLALVMTLPLFLAGCHGAVDKEVFSVPDTFDTSKKIDLVFWAKNDSNTRQIEIYNQAISEFEALYPNVHITMKLYSKYEEIYTDVLTNIATNTTPNVCITYPDNVATYITGDNVVVPLDDLVNDSKYGLGGSELLFDGPTKDEMIEKFYNECKIESNQYAIPFMRSSEACYINKDYVEALGFTIPDILTWDFIWEVCNAAMKKNEDGTYAVNGQKIMYPFIYKSTDNMMIQMIEQKGGDFSDAQGNIKVFNDTTTEILSEIYTHAKERTFETFNRVSYPGNFFNAGQCIFAIDSTAGATWMGSEAPLLDIPEDKIVHFETVVRPIPQYDVENPKMISQGPSLCVFNKEDPQVVLASWLFTQYLLTDTIQTAYAEIEGYVPVTTKAQNNPNYVEYLSKAGEDNDQHYDVKIAASKVVLDNVDNSFTTPVFNGSASLRSAAGDLIEDVVKSGVRKVEFNEDYIKDLYTRMNSLHKLDQISKTNAKIDMGPLPTGAIVLLVGLGVVWAMIIPVAIVGYFRSRKEQNQ